MGNDNDMDMAEMEEKLNVCGERVKGGKASRRHKNSRDSRQYREHTKKIVHH